MSNSNLASYTDTSHGKYNTRNAPITRITIHHLASVGDLSKITSIIRTNEVSWNYGIARNGAIGMFVPEDFRSWSTGNTDNDAKSVNIVICNSQLSPNWTVSEAAIASLKKLCYDICVRNNITKLTYTKHLSGSNITLHSWFDNDVVCPGPSILGRLDEVIKHVNDRLKSYVSTKNSDQQSLFNIRVQYAITPSGKYLTFDEVTALEMYRYSMDTSTGSADGMTVTLDNGKQVVITFDMFDYKMDWKIVDGKQPIDYPIIDYELETNRQALHPYIVTLSETTKTVDYNKLTSIGAVGVMLYGGSLFNASHETQSYQPAYLRSQVEQADNANFPYGLYVKVRALSVQEARVELHSLFQVVSKFPPELGIWLCLESKATNVNEILDCYYTQIQKWSLNSKCGLYVTRSQLSKISWSKYKQYFLLCLVDHLSDISKVNEVLTESFFNL